MNEKGLASREAEADAVSVTVPVEILPEETEQFTIDLQDAKVPTLVLSWDYMQVSVPLQ